MCDPATIGILQVVSGVLGAVGTYQQGQAQAAAYEHAAKSADINAAIKERQAHEEVLAGAEQEKKLKMKISGLKGEQRAIMGASGFAPDTGTSLETIVDTSEQGMRDVETLRYNAQNRRLNAVDESNTYKDQALWNRSAASSAKNAGMIGAVTGLIGTGATVASSWYKMGFNPMGGGGGWNLATSGGYGAGLGGSGSLKLPTWGIKR